VTDLRQNVVVAGNIARHRRGEQPDRRLGERHSEMRRLCQLMIV